MLIKTSFFLHRDILFDRIYERFAMDIIARGTFLECLEPYILNDKLTEIPARVMKDFVEHHEGRGYLDTVEACIVHMHVSSLDIHQVNENRHSCLYWSVTAGEFLLVNFISIWVNV